MSHLDIYGEFSSSAPYEVVQSLSITEKWLVI